MDTLLNSSTVRVIRLEMSLSSRIIGYLAIKKVSSYRELKDKLKVHKKAISSTLFYMCKIRKLRRLPFSTKWGKIVYLPNTDPKLVWNYLYDNDLIPKTTAYFFQEMQKRKCISTIEFYDEGLDIIDIRFFIDAFTKQWKFFKIKKVNNYNIFYFDEKELEKYISKNMNRIQDLQAKEWKRKEKEGEVFEDVVEKFYQSKGFDTERNRWFSTADGEKVEIDILARKKLFKEPKERGVIIAVECKSWKQSRHFYNLTEFLRYYCRVKELLPSAHIHIWSYNYSNNFFNPSFLKRFPTVSLYWSKHIREAFRVAETMTPEIKTKQ